MLIEYPLLYLEWQLLILLGFDETIEGIECLELLGSSTLQHRNGFLDANALTFCRVSISLNGLMAHIYIHSPLFLVKTLGLYFDVCAGTGSQASALTHSTL